MKHFAWIATVLLEMFIGNIQLADADANMSHVDALMPATPSPVVKIAPALIDRLLTPGNLPQINEMDAAGYKKLLDKIADSETSLLDKNNKNWNSSNSNWGFIFDRVHGDLESGMPLATINSELEKIRHSYEKDIASNLSKSDVNTMLAYYDSSQGKRYQDFMQRIDRIMNSGMATLLAPKQIPSSQNNLTPDQINMYMKLLQMSQPFQMTMALAEIANAEHRDASGYGAIGFLAGVAIKANQLELETLSKKYANDIPSFEAFSKTESSHHFYIAMGKAVERLGGNSIPIGNLIQSVEQKHKNEWMSLFQSQTQH